MNFGKTRRGVRPLVFDESNESLERRESVNDDVGLDFSMGRL